MDDFNKKQEFHELGKLTPTGDQKKAIMERIQNSTMKPRNSFKYIFSSITAILLAVLIFLPSIFTSIEENDHSTNKPLEHFKSKMEIGLTMDEVKEILGEQFMETYYGGIPVWKYEIGKTGEYEFSDGFFNYVDFEEMKQEKIQMLAFIFWDENNLVKQYSSLYLNEKDSKIYDYKVLANGKVFEESIYPTETANDSHNVDLEIELFKSKMKIGTSMEQVKAILGDHYSVKIPSDSGVPIWIYEVDKSKGYQFINEFGFADLEGMKQGKIKAHLSIVWNETNLVQEYSALYLNEHDNRVYEFRVFPDGQSKDNPINFESKVVLPDGIPDFVRESDFEDINWERKAVEFGDRKILGNENKSGVIGVDMPSLKEQKWMWHLWGIENPTSTKLTVIGYHKETKSVHQILITGWTTQLWGEHNGADAHVPSSVSIPMAGEWAMLLYTDVTLFDVLIYEIYE